MSQPFAASRGLTVSSPAIAVVGGRPVLVPLKLEGTEGINQLFDYRLTLQTPDAMRLQPRAMSNLELHKFVGLEITCFVELENQGDSLGGVREISALITQARHVGEDDRRAIYELTLRPWLHLATLRSDCKVFQNQTPVQTIADVLACYNYATTTRFVEDYPVRDYCVQYNETDFEFVSRLMQEWGINYHFEHTGGVHRLILSDHNGGFQAAPEGPGLGAYRSIAFYPLGHKIDEEYIHGFSPGHALTSGSYASRDYDYTRPRADLAATAAAPRQTGHAQQEVYLWRGDRSGPSGVGGSDYSQPNAGSNAAGTDKAANQTEAQGKHLARLRMQALGQPGLRAQGLGHVRGVVPGRTFSLTGHPQEKANAEYIVLETRFSIETMGEDTQRNALVALPVAEHLSGRWRVLTEFEVQPTAEVLRPVATQHKPKVGGPETALVVGPGDDTAASNIYTDTLGRIKVQFPWDRYGGNNQNSSCWLRVSSAWAGNQLGAMHVPRIGEEVLVDFLGGDPDLPVVVGRLFNQLNMPPWRLPEQQALSGFRSRELTPGGGNSAAGRSNHVLLDDSDGQIQAQIKSDHQHSQLSLGFITRIEDNTGRKDVRGQGFELRTDGHGVLRAKDGMLISTEGRTAAQGHVKDMGETTARLGQAQDQHQSLGSLASQHLAQDAGDQDEVAADLQTQNAGIKGKAVEGSFPELSEPHLVFASPAGIASTTPGCTHQHSGRHHAITSGGHTSISSAKSFLVSARNAVRLFAYKSGIKLVSAAADIDAQALDKSLHILAKVSITETADSITLTAKEELSINGGGSFSNFKGGSITHGTAGTWNVHAAVKAMEGPQSVAAVLPPTASKDSLNEMFVLRNQHGTLLANFPYKITLEDGRVVRGLTNEKGEAQRIYTGEKPMQMRIGMDDLA